MATIDITDAPDKPTPVRLKLLGLETTVQQPIQQNLLVIFGFTADMTSCISWFCHSALSNVAADEKNC